MDPYSPVKFFRQVKKIKSLLKEHDPKVVMKACLSYLYAPEEEELDHLRRHPWLILLIIKWAFVGKSNIHYIKKPLDHNSFNRILRLTHELGDLIRLPSDHVHLNLFMRTITYQQLIYQKSFSLSTFSRQSILFGKLDENHRLKAGLKDKYGLNVEQFLMLSLLVCSKFLNTKNSKITLDQFATVAPQIGWDPIIKFLGSISVEFDDLPRKLTSFNKSRGGWQEFYEQSPFLNFPLIKNGEVYTCVNPFILYRTLENLIYDLLKRPDPGAFMDSFGRIFEDYLQLGLDQSGIKYTTEVELLKSIPPNVNCVDYVLEEDRANIFIDAKAVEMPYLGKISDSPEIIQQKVKGSAIKAIEQAISINGQAFQQQTNNFPIGHRQENYLLVVTFKELGLMNGRVLYDALAKDTLDQLFSEKPPEALLELQNIFFITIDEFDYLMELETERKGAIVDLLRKAVSDNEETSTRKYDFSQHLSSFEIQAQPPSFLREEQERLFKITQDLF